MGAHKHLYLGPYVECTYKPATRTENVRGCTNSKCKRHPTKRGPDLRGKFCEECASPIADVAITVKDRPDRYDIVGDELFEINTTARDVLYLAPNVRRKGDPRPDFDDDDAFHLNLVEVEPEQEMAWFMDAFAKELRKLEAAYATVVVKWGLHQYFM